MYLCFKVLSRLLGVSLTSPCSLQLCSQRGSRTAAPPLNEFSHIVLSGNDTAAGCTRSEVGYTKIIEVNTLTLTLGLSIISNPIPNISSKYDLFHSLFILGKIIEIGIRVTILLMRGRGEACILISFINWNQQKFWLCFQLFLLRLGTIITMQRNYSIKRLRIYRCSIASTYAYTRRNLALLIDFVIGSHYARTRSLSGLQYYACFADSDPIKR